MGIGMKQVVTITPSIRPHATAGDGETEVVLLNQHEE